MANLTEADVQRLFDAYEAAENDDARDELVAFVAESTTSRTLFGAHNAFVEAHMADFDADEIVEEFEEDEPMSVDEAQELFNEQSPDRHGHVIKTFDGSEYPLYVGTSGDLNALDEYDAPDGWHMETSISSGVMFYQDG